MDLTKRQLLGAVTATVGILLALAGFGASMAMGALDATPHEAASETAGATTGGLALDARIHLDAGVVTVDRSLSVSPEAARKAPLPGLTVDDDQLAPHLPLGVPLDADLDVTLRSGEHTTPPRTKASTGVVEDEGRPVDAQTATIALAAIAATGAGLLAYFGSGLKSAGRFFALPILVLYARVRRAEVFDNAVREGIFSSIREKPGIAATDLARLAGVSWGTTIYHLEVLEQNGMVTSLRAGRHRRYFVNGAELPASKQAVAVLQNGTTANIVGVLRAIPGATQKELARAAGMTPQALHWHLSRLVAAGLVRKEREGRVVRHYGAN